jgi:hypothetical protein
MVEGFVGRRVGPETFAGAIKLDFGRHKWYLLHQSSYFLKAAET